MPDKTIVFIHGAFLTPSSWYKFAGWFAKRGYRVHTPAWPGKDRTVAQIRADAAGLAGVGLGEILDHYAVYVGELGVFDELITLVDTAEMPILIGHSVGGLIVQVMLDCGIGSAGVAIHPAPPRGVPVVQPSALRSVAPVLAKPSNRRGIVRMSFPQWRYAFAHTLPEDEARAAYERYVTPETGRPFFQTAFSMFHRYSPALVDFGNESRPPLLLIGGGQDHLVPASLTFANYRKYRRSPARTDYHEYPDRVHWTIAQNGWEEVAFDVDQWLASALNS